MIKVFRTESQAIYSYNSLTNKISFIGIPPDENSAVSDAEWEARLAASVPGGNEGFREIKWPYSFQEYCDQMKDAIPGLVLQITKKCNLRCSYCAVSGGSCKDTSRNTDMSEETVYKSIDFFANHNIRSETAHISFYGGEALLRLALLKKAVGYAKKRIIGKDVTFNISTNGLLLTVETASWLAENSGISVTCTVNGPYHDKYRKTVSGEPSLEQIMERLTFIRDNYPEVWNNQIRFIANVDFETEIPDLISFYYARLGKLPGLVTSIYWETEKAPANPSYGEQNATHNDIDFSAPSPLRDFYVENLYEIKNRSILEDADYAVINSCFPCRVKMFVHADETISFCEQISDNFNIGNLNSGFDYGLLKKLYETGWELYEKRCLTCWAQRLCGVCLRDMIGSNGDILDEIPHIRCEANRKGVLKKLKQFCQMVEQAPDLVN